MRCRWMSCISESSSYFLLKSDQLLHFVGEWHVLPVCAEHKTSVLAGCPDKLELEEVCGEAVSAVEVLGEGIARVTMVTPTGYFVWIGEEFLESLKNIVFK